MIQLIGAVIQIIFLILKNKFEKDAEIRKKKEELHNEAKSAVSSGDLSRINAVIDRLR